MSLERSRNSSETQLPPPNVDWSGITRRLLSPNNLRTAGCAVVLMPAAFCIGLGIGIASEQIQLEVQLPTPPSTYWSARMTTECVQTPSPADPFFIGTQVRFFDVRPGLFGGVQLQGPTLSDICIDLRFPADPPQPQFSSENS